MYKSVEIKNFRLFRDFKITGLARINLFAGANNVGKTSLLEALYVQQRPNETMSVMQVNSLRGLEGLGKEPKAIWGSLFTDLNTEDAFQISTLDDAKTKRDLKISLANTDSVKITAESGQEELSDILSRAISDKLLEFRYSENGKLLVSGRAFRVSDGIQGIGRTDIKRPPAHFLGARSRASSRILSENFGELVKNKRENEIIEYLKIIEPQLKSLSILPTDAGTMLWADLGKKQMLPIYLLGDGFGRLLAIASAFPSASDGIMLIDEAENGIYHKSMIKVWEIIRKMAMEYNVQIFATTHSQECVYAAHEAFKNAKPKNFKFFRLDRKDDGIIPAEYDIETLGAAIEMNLEVR